MIKRSPSKTATTAMDNVVKKSNAKVERIPTLNDPIVALRKRSLEAKILFHIFADPKKFQGVDST